MEHIFDSGKSDSGFQFRDFVSLMKKHAKLFAGIFFSFLAISVALYAFKIPYIGKGRLLVNDSQNSSLQAFSTSYFGMTKSVADGKKGNTQIGKQIEVLRTREFYEKLLGKLETRAQAANLSVEEQKAYENIREKYLVPALKDEESRQRFIMKLDSWSQAKMESDYEIRVSMATPSKDLSLVLTNTTLDLASEFLREREMQEIGEVEKFISEQKQQVDKNIQELAREVSNFQTKPENIISMTSQEKMGEYLSDLMVRINETQLKISENNKDIEFLQDGNTGRQAGSSLYGVGGRIEALRLENKMLTSRLSQLRSSVDRIGKTLKVLPVSMQLLEDKKKKSELEYAKYRELSDTLAKVEAQKLSIRDRFEILEKARRDNTHPQVDLATLVFLSAILSLVFGLTVLYIKYMWMPVPQPQKDNVRNVTLFSNDHNQDPRVVFENAKIKFQLGNHGSVE